MGIETRDCRAFMRDFHTPGTRAHEHALDLSIMICELMDERGLNKTELARRMGVSKSNLSNMLNTQPNMTLETIARFELALDATLELRLVPNAPSKGALEDGPLSAEG